MVQCLHYNIIQWLTSKPNSHSFELLIKTSDDGNHADSQWETDHVKISNLQYMSTTPATAQTPQ